MITELMHDPIFLAGKSEVATKEDLQVAQDLLDTITFMARLTIKNSAGNKNLLARILEGNFEVQTMSIQREDYAYLE